MTPPSTDPSPVPDVPPLDAHLRAALQHAPDAALEPPAALDERILRAAQAVGRPQAAGGATFLRRLVGALARALDAARAPVPAAALGSLVLATVVVALWGPGVPPQDETPAPESAPALGPSTAEAPAPQAAPVPPGPSAAPTPAPAARARLEPPAPAAPPSPAPSPAPPPAPESLAQRSTAAEVAQAPEPPRLAAAPSTAPAPAPRGLMKSAPPRLAADAAVPVETSPWTARPRDEAPAGGPSWPHPVDGQPGRLVVIDRPPALTTEVWWIPDAGPAWRLRVPAELGRPWRERAKGRPADAAGPWPPVAVPASAPR